MTQLALLSALAFAVCLVLTPLALLLGKACGLVDRPDGRRKLHRAAVPVTGGIAIFVSCTLTLLVGAEWSPQLLSLFLAGAAFCALGVVDDLRLLRGRHKLLGQFAIASFIVIAADLTVQRVALLHWRLELGLLAVPFTLFWLVGSINAMNLLDGMDGLLSAVALPILAALAILAIGSEQWTTAALALTVAGALLGFAVYNFPPARIFLGDAGSMLIGLLAGVLALQVCLMEHTLPLLMPLALFAIPVFDTLAAIVRRKLTGRSIFTTDRGHLHHCLHNRGLSSRGVILCVTLLGMCIVAGCLAGQFYHSEFMAPAASGIVVVMLIATRSFGHAEFRLLKQRLTQFFTPVRHEKKTASERGDFFLQGSIGWKVLMDSLSQQADALNLTALHLDINAPALHEGYHGVWKRRVNEADGVPLWRAEIPITLHAHMVGQLAVVGIQDVTPMWQRIAALMQAIATFESSNVLFRQDGASALRRPHGPRLRANVHARTERESQDI